MAALATGASIARGDRLGAERALRMLDGDSAIVSGRIDTPSAPGFALFETSSWEAGGLKQDFEASAAVVFDGHSLGRATVGVSLAELRERLWHDVQLVAAMAAIAVVAALALATRLLRGIYLPVMGLTATQKGPLWWAAHHRNHHKYSDQPEDLHSPRQRGFWWSHMFWILVRRHQFADHTKVKDLAAYPELRFIDRFEILFTIAYAAALYAIGGSHALVWGYFVSTVVLWHLTFTINSLAHVWGARRYPTSDDSRNNPLLAILTLGEGWHNNHHHYQRSARQGFYWWEVDLSFYVLKLLEVFHIVWDVQGVPRHVRDHRPAAPVDAEGAEAIAPPVR